MLDSSEKIEEQNMQKFVYEVRGIDTKTRNLARKNAEAIVVHRTESARVT